ncbi:hypothetical protein U1Q18_032485 [Sarracenia purpurea var. burkii]
MLALLRSHLRNSGSAAMSVDLNLQGGGRQNGEDGAGDRCRLWCHERGLEPSSWIDAVGSFYEVKKNGTRKLHPIAWDNVCKSKSDGGLGVKKTQEMNLALLAKLG